MSFLSSAIIFLFLILLFFISLTVIGFRSQRYGAQPSAATTTPPNPSKISAFYNWAKKDMFSAAVLALFIVIVVAISYSYWQNNLEGPAKTFAFSSEQEFQQNFDRVSGNWYVSGNCLKGSGEFQLKNSAELKWWKIKILPCEKEITDASVNVGNFRFNYQKYEDSRSSLYGAVIKKYVIGNIYYGKAELAPVGGTPTEVFGEAPLPVTVISDKSVVYSKSPDLKILVGDIDVVSSRSYLAEYAGAPTGTLAQGTISFYFSSNTGISKIEIY